MESQSPKDVTDYYKHLSLFWTDIIHLMASKPQALTSIGPMRAFASNSKKISTELIQINESLMEFNKFVTEYYKQLSETWSDAQKKVNLKAPDVPHDVEQMESFKRIWIDIFDNDFTELFDSEKFGVNYGKLVSKELELTKHWSNISNVILQSVNLPSKEEIDEVYKEMHALKKRVTKLEIELKKKRETKNEGGVKNEK
ncbi:MAG: poly(R)-hydroxyalkanoic acid synthase subunit PhaE [Nitrosarchaeum sp.]|nr:poly(R)-hydroxyalkanoic acid synthase subunit PhaE [Nitrosarchaeum sp.]